MILVHLQIFKIYFTTSKKIVTDYAREHIVFLYVKRT